MFKNFVVIDTAGYYYSFIGDSDSLRGAKMIATRAENSGRADMCAVYRRDDIDADTNAPRACTRPAAFKIFSGAWVDVYAEKQPAAPGRVTRSWKVYGAAGHRQRESFYPSYSYDFSTEKDGVRKISVSASDLTGTHDYVIISITRPTADACEKELAGQISDGIFENSRVGAVIEIAEV